MFLRHATSKILKSPKIGLKPSYDAVWGWSAFETSNAWTKMTKMLPYFSTNPVINLIKNRDEHISLTYNPTTRLGLQNLSPIFKSARMVRDVYVNVVEDIIGILFWIFARNDARILRISILINVAAHRKSCSAILLAWLNWVTPGNLRFFSFVTSNIENNYYGNETHWHVVDDPMMLVVHSHSFS